MFDYFIKGFHLTNSAYKLVLFSFGLLMALYLFILLTESAWAIFAGIAAIIFSILSVCETLISPLILSQQQKTNLSFSKILDIFKSNLPRTIKGAIVFASCFLLVIIIISIVMISLLLGTGIDSEKLNENRLLIGFILYTTLGIISGLGIFTPIYYSLEKKSLISSIISSVKFAFNHLTFFALLLLLSALYILPTQIPINENTYLSFVIEILNSLFTAYIGTWVIATALIYYQKHS